MLNRLFSGQDKIVPGILVLVPLVLFWQTLGFEFVWDDIEIHILKNPFLQQITLENILHFWKEPYKQLYIPVAYTAWAGLKSFAGTSPVLYHLANIILHALNGLLVYVIIGFFVKDRWAAAIGTLIFIVHPIQVESVAWVSEMRGLLASFLGLLSLYCYIHFCKLSYDTDASSNGPLFLAFSWVLFTCALLSKPSAVVIPILAAVADRYLYHTGFKKICLRIIAFCIPVLIVTIVTSSIQTKAATCPIWARPLIWGDTVVFYLYKLVYPISLAASYAREPALVLSQWWVYIIWIVPVSIGLLLWVKREQFPLAGLSYIWFIIGFLPVSGLLEFTFQFWSTVADRYLYLSMPGVALGVAAMLTQAKPYGKYIMGFIIALLTMHSAFFQIPTWQNSYTLWSHCIEVTSTEHRAFTNRGRSYLQAGKLEKALADFDHSISMNDKDATSFNNRGKVHSLKEDYNKAHLDFTRAIRLKPNYADAYYNRGLVYDSMNKFERALADYDRAIELHPYSPEYYNNRGIVLGLKGKNQRALADFNKAIAINGNYYEAVLNRGITFYFMGQYQKAHDDLILAQQSGQRIDESLLKEIETRLSK